MAEYYNISVEEINAFLLPQGFQAMSLPNTHELVYGKRINQNGMQMTMRVYTGINPSGESRGVGDDAMHVNLFIRLPNGEIKKLFGSKRVHRVKGWKKNLQDRINEVSQNIPKKMCNRCGLPMVLREGKNKSTGKEYKFYGCVGYPQCSNTLPAESAPNKSITKRNYNKGQPLTKQEVIGAINTNKILFVVYEEPNPHDAHHSMQGVGILIKTQNGISFANVSGVGPQVQDIGAFEDLPIPHGAYSNDGIFTDDDGNSFEFFEAV